MDDVKQLCADQWKKLSKQEKQPYEVKAAWDKVRYAEELQSQNEASSSQSAMAAEGSLEVQKAEPQRCIRPAGEKEGAPAKAGRRRAPEPLLSPTEIVQKKQRSAAMTRSHPFVADRGTSLALAGWGEIDTQLSQTY